MNRRNYTYNKGCLGTFIGGFFFLPAFFLLMLASLSRNDDYCAQRGPNCLAEPDMLPFYLVLGILFLAAGILSAYVMLIRKRR